MNQKLKQHLKTMIFIFGISFFIIGCQKDDDVNTSQQESLTTQNVFKVSKVGKSTIDENSDLLGRLSNLSEKVEQSRLANANKNIYSSEDNFYINTDFATYMENTQTGYHSYTFPVFRTEQTDGIENVLLSLQEGGSYKASLIVYDLNDQEQLDLQNELNVDLTDKITIYSLEDDSFVDDVFSKVLASGDCVGILMCPYEGNDHPAGQDCIDADRGDLYLDTSMCESGGGGGVGDSDGGDPSDTDTDTSTGHVEAGGTGSGSTVVTIPQPWEEVALCLGLNSGYTFDMTAWLQQEENRDIASQINNFLQENGCNEDTQQFATNAISALVNEEITTFEEHFTIENINPNCESFNYSRVGGTNWQCAAVSNVRELFLILNWECTGFDWGIFTQPLYFQLPINLQYPLDSGATKIQSAVLLQLGFENFDAWYQQNGCATTPTAMEQQLLDYIKDEFEYYGGKCNSNTSFRFYRYSNTI